MIRSNESCFHFSPTSYKPTTMEVGGNGNPSPSLAGPPPPGSGTNSSTWGDMTKNTVIAIFSTITGAITTYLVANCGNYTSNLSVTHLQMLSVLLKNTTILRPPAHLISECKNATEVNGVYFLSLLL
ncbi:hypothetical protein FH972_027099 [Carpinus fangiana]|uniref:Uncharacterized protein n=1 Tax=Carpinus fangiana TaxID=176857 RepID=A0A5N6L627_9ROSI|nr:hypothetical protein FH972_027099 [Carpinus fangiana]